MDNNFDSKQSDNFDETKRKSLIKMGKRAVYVTPVVLTLLTSAKASPISACAGAPGNSCGSSGNNPGGGGASNGKSQTGNNGGG